MYSHDLGMTVLSLNEAICGQWCEILKNIWSKQEPHPRPAEVVPNVCIFYIQSGKEGLKRPEREAKRLWRVPLSKKKWVLGTYTTHSSDKYILNQADMIREEDIELFLYSLPQQHDRASQMQRQTFCDKKQSSVDQPQRPLHRTECKADETGLCRSDCLVPSPSLRPARSPHGSCCAFRGGMGSSRFSHTWWDPVPQRGLLTWEPIIIKITQVGNALPKVCIVGTISSQGQLFLKGSLGNRMEVAGKKEGGKKKKTTMKTRSSEHHPLRVQPWAGNSWAESWEPKSLSSQQSQAFHIRSGSLQIA